MSQLHTAGPTTGVLAPSSPPWPGTLYGQQPTQIYVGILLWSSLLRNFSSLAKLNAVPLAFLHRTNFSITICFALLDHFWIFNSCSIRVPDSMRASNGLLAMKIVKNYLGVLIVYILLHPHKSQGIQCVGENQILWLLYDFVKREKIWHNRKSLRVKERQMVRMWFLRLLVGWSTWNSLIAFHAGSYLSYDWHGHILFLVHINDES